MPHTGLASLAGGLVASLVGVVGTARRRLAKASCKIFAVERCGATTGACCCSFSSSDKARSMTLDAIAAAALFLVLGAQGCLAAARKITHSKLAQSDLASRCEDSCTTRTGAAARPRARMARPQCQRFNPC